MLLLLLKINTTRSWELVHNELPWLLYTLCYKFVKQNRRKYTMNLALNLQSSKKFTIGVQISEKSGWEQGKKEGAGESLSG